MNTKYFIYIDSDNKNISDKVDVLKKNISNDKLKIFTESGNTFETEFIIYESVINKFENYNVNEYRNIFLGNRGYNEHSLVSFAFIDKSKIYCYCDKFGIMPYYYYIKDNSVVISNNSILIAFITDVQYSIESIYDALIFKKPVGKKTWYKDIYCTSPGSKLTYNPLGKSLGIEIYYNMFDDLFNNTNKNYIDVFKDFFMQFNNSKNENEIGLSLSGGSDSRTILAGLLYIGCKFNCYSWGGDEYLELHKINKLVNDLNLNSVEINFNELKIHYDNYIEKGMFATSGLLTAIHQFYFYSHLPVNINQFEGYFGSELLKGELSDGMVTEIYSEIIKKNFSSVDAIKKYYSSVDDNLLSGFINYIYDNYSHKFVDINSEKGKFEFQKYLFDTIPSKIFSGLIPQGLSQDINYYLPFFSPEFLKSLFSAGYGIKNNISLRNDFPGTIKIIDAQAKIVKGLNYNIYNSLLDRNIMFKEAFYPYFVVKNLRRYRILKDKRKIKKYKIIAQVDYTNIKKDSMYEKIGINKYIFDYFGNNCSENKSLNYVSYYLNVLDAIKNKNKIAELLY